MLFNCLKKMWKKFVRLFYIKEETCECVKFTETKTEVKSQVKNKNTNTSKKTKKAKK